MSAGVVDSRLLRSYCRCISNAVASVVQGERRGKLAWPLLSRRPHSRCISNASQRYNIPIAVHEFFAEKINVFRKKSTLLGKESTTSGKVVKLSQVSESTFSVHILLHFQLLTPDS
jgi:hypothetical protein